MGQPIVTKHCSVTKHCARARPDVCVASENSLDIEPRWDGRRADPVNARPNNPPPREADHEHSVLSIAAASACA